MWLPAIVTGEIIAFAILAISNSFWTQKQAKEVQIVVIGAGPSGIAAASRLLENGIDNIVILEAENRIGGRVNTIKLGDGVIDMGGQWVHGEEGNIAFKLGNENDLLMDSMVGLGKEITFIEESGRVVDQGTAAKYLNVFDEITESTHNLDNYSGSLGQYFEEEYPKKLEQYSLTDPHLKALFFHWYEKAENILDASDSWYYTSAQGQKESVLCKGNQNLAWKSGGYHTVLDILMKRIPDPSKELPVLSKVNLNCEVMKIIWDYRDKVQVGCSDGSVYQADQVIVTVSLGVLKERAHYMFSPALPTSKLNAIKGLGFGTVAKVYLKFSNKWWPGTVAHYAFLHPDDKPPCRSRDCWTKDLSMFTLVDNQPLLLCGWVVGPAARIMEQLPLEEVTREAVKLLNDFFGKAYNIIVPEPELVIRSTWYSNPHFRGSYSFRSLDTEAMGVYAADLAEPVFNSKSKLPVLMFAGEATHSQYFSTVHGAIESGLREADRISEALKKL